MNDEYKLSLTPTATVEQMNRAIMDFGADDLIKRWRMDHGAGSDGSVWADAEPDDEGDFVRYNDHAAALSEAHATIARLEAALRIGRAYVARSIEDWGVDDEASAAMQEDLRVIDAALSPRGGEG